MSNKIIYLNAQKVIEFNILALAIVKAKKADKAEVASYTKIIAVLDECEKSQEDIYGKAVILLKGIIQKHPFVSGNRRTAFLAAKYFLIINGAKASIRDEESQARVLLGIRENYYTDEEIREWIKNGKIREFVR